MMAVVKRALPAPIRSRLGELRRRVADHLTAPLPVAAPYVAAVRGLDGLEIGGPSRLFRAALPAYRAIGSLDGANFATATVWHDEHREGGPFSYLPGRRPGRQYVREATDLTGIPSGRYDVVLSSHCLEHVANPIKALYEWQRVLRPSGALLLVLPHKEGTFDHRRPTTTLAHMIEDYERGVGEDDMTHATEEIDADRTTPSGAASLPNLVTRMMHHHVFDLRTALQLVDYVGFQIELTDTALPYHIIILARMTEQAQNSGWLAPTAGVYAASQFQLDRTGVSL